MLITSLSLNTGLDYLHYSIWQVTHDHEVIQHMNELFLETSRVIACRKLSEPCIKVSQKNREIQKP